MKWEMCLCVYMNGWWNVTTTILVLTHAPQNISNIFIVCVCVYRKFENKMHGYENLF